jgi:hypothetical protein
MPADDANPLLGLDEQTYLALFLDESDLPELGKVQDSRAHGADPGDDAFPRHGGLFGGFQAWMAGYGAVVWRVVDIRWVLPTPAEASAYHRERLRANSEGLAALSGSPLVGSQCVVYGGTQPTPIDPSITMTTFFYVFRVENVVVKLFLAQGPELEAGTLTPGDAASLADRIIRRLGG